MALLPLLWPVNHQQVSSYATRRPGLIGTVHRRRGDVFGAGVPALPPAPPTRMLTLVLPTARAHAEHSAALSAYVATLRLDAQRPAPVAVQPSLHPDVSEDTLQPFAPAFDALMQHCTALLHPIVGTTPRGQVDRVIESVVLEVTQFAIAWAESNNAPAPGSTHSCHSPQASA